MTTIQIAREKSPKYLAKTSREDLSTILETSREHLCRILQTPQESWEVARGTSQEFLRRPALHLVRILPTSPKAPSDEHIATIVATSQKAWASWPVCVETIQTFAIRSSGFLQALLLVN